MDRGVLSDEQVAASAERIRKARKDMVLSYVQHKCSAQRCMPLSEHALVESGHLEPPALTSQVYVCRFGAVHVCTADACELYRDTVAHTCPLSGINHGGQVSAYSRHDSRSWFAPSVDRSVAPRPSRPPVPPALSKTAAVLKKLEAYTEEQVRERASHMVKLLLFSNARVKLNDAVIARRVQDAQHDCEEYRRAQRAARQLPYATDLHRIRGWITSQPFVLREYEFDEHLHDYYVGVIVQVWERVLQYAREGPTLALRTPHCDADTISIGTLYCMRKGMVQNGHVMLPCDSFLAQNLPAIGDLAVHFDVNRNRITCGDSIVTAALLHALRCRGGASLDATKLQTLAAEELEDLRRSAQSKSRVPVKVSTNGDILFMPQSRKKRKVH